MLISTGGTVIKMPVEDVKRLGRSTQGVIVMRLREGETVSTLAPVVDAGDETASLTDATGEQAAAAAEAWLAEADELLAEDEDEEGEEDTAGGGEDEPSSP